MFNAIESVGRDALLIKNNEVLGTVWVGASCNYTASIHMTEELYAKYIKPLVAREIGPCVLPEHKLVCFRFGMFSGVFYESNFEEGSDKIAVEAWMADTRIVDKHYFELGIVPKAFANVPGFGAVLKQSGDSA